MSAFKKILKDQDMSLDRISNDDKDIKWLINSKKLKNLIKEESNLIALKSNDKFIIADKRGFPNYVKMELLNKTIIVDDEELPLYELKPYMYKRYVSLDELERNASISASQKFEYSVKDYVVKENKKVEKNNELKNHYNFEYYYDFPTLREIKSKAKELIYEDYCDLVAFYDNYEKYFCVACIIDGDFGLKYYIKTPDYYDYIDFEECDLNLDDEVSLTLDMKNKLDNFVKNLKINSVDVDDIKISL